MPLKLNISNKGKAWKLEVAEEVIAGKSIGDIIPGKALKPELEGYELQITGGSDKSGFPMDGDTEGIGYKKVLLTKGWGMHTKPKGLKKKQPRLTKGLRLRKTVRGKTISEKSSQINMTVLSEGKTPLEKIFPDQNQPKEAPAAETLAQETPAAEAPKEPTPEKTADKKEVKE